MAKEKQIIAGTVTSTSNNMSGRRRLSISFDFAEYEQGKKGMFEAMFHELPVNVAVAVITNEAATEDMQPKEDHPYGNEAKILKQSSFLRTPEVWKAIGSDETFKVWIRQQPCCACGQLSCEERRIEAAHVLRIADGAGMGIKPEYSCIPLCRTCHQSQHDEGETFLGGKEFSDKQRILYVSKWAWELLKEQLGESHWYDVTPESLRYWAESNDVDKYLPKIYKRG